MWRGCRSVGRHWSACYLRGFERLLHLHRVVALFAIGMALVGGLPSRPASAQHMDAAVAKALADYSAEVAVPKKAFVIGIGAYDALDSLTTPPIDARNMALALRGLDFEVTSAPGSKRSWPSPPLSFIR